ncbi:MAG: putative CRISPR-associated protein [Thermoprotei archaeon]
MPKRTLHICTVGTSLLSNIEKGTKKVEEMGFKDWWRLPGDDPRQEQLSARAKKGDPLFELALEFVRAEGQRASAELSTLLHPNIVDKTQDEVRLYPTYTGNSFFASMVLYVYLREKGYTVHDPSQTRLMKTQLDFEDEFGGVLHSLMDKVGGDIASYSKKGWSVYIHATAGFKAESSFMVIVGSLMGADLILYKHESFSGIVELPTLRLRVDDGLIKELKEFSRGPVPVAVAKGLSLSPYALDELKALGYIRETASGYVLREWVKRYLEIKES